MFKKDKAWVCKIVMEHQEQAERWANSKIRKEISADLHEHLDKYHPPKPNSPILRPAWQARIISEHGADSRDWKEYNKQIEQITRWINDKCVKETSERFILYYDPLNDSTQRTLHELGYMIEPENDATRISW